MAAGDGSADPWTRGKVTRTFPWIPWPWRGRDGPQRYRFILPEGGGLGAHLRLPVLPAGGFGQEKGDGTMCRFLDTFCKNREQLLERIDQALLWVMNRTGDNQRTCSLKRFV